MHELSSIEEELKKNLAEFENYYVKASEIDKGTRHNNQLIIP